MRKYLFITFLFILSIAYSQEKVEWSSDYTLSEKDFKATPPSTGTQQTVYLGMTLEYSLQNYKLFFSNLNSSVSNYFVPSASWLDPGESTESLIKFAEVGWDLNEVAARKMRKELHENRMKISSNFVNEIYISVTSENTELMSQYSKETDFGSDESKQEVWKLKVTQLLEEYKDYCKSCKPAKRKKKK